MKRPDTFELEEDIVGDKIAYTYHRTDKQWVQSVIDNGWKPGTGDMYGVGLYTCWDLKDQLDGTWNPHNPMFRRYGDGETIFKFRVDMKARILHFDYNMAKRLLGKKYSIVDQLVALGIYPDAKKVPEFWNKVHEFLDTRDPKENSAFMVVGAWWNGLNHGNWGGFNQRAVGFGVDFLVNSVANVRNANEKWRIAGVTYEGDNDHKVLLMYDFMSVIPIAYTQSDKTGSHLVPVVTDQDAAEASAKGVAPVPKLWHRLINMRDIKTSMNATALDKMNNPKDLVNKQYPMGSIKGLRTDWNAPDIGVNALTRLTKDFPWTQAPIAVFSDAVLDVEGANLHFVEGTWKAGIFKGVEFGSQQGWSLGSNVDNKAVFYGNRMRMTGRINGGMPVFWGVMASGVFENGRFCGSWKGGRIDLDNTVWDDRYADMTGTRSSLGTARVGVITHKMFTFKGKDTVPTHGMNTMADFMNEPENQGLFVGVRYISADGKMYIMDATGSKEIPLVETKDARRDVILEGTGSGVVKGQLFENMFKVQSLSPADQDLLFATFEKSYIDATGAAFSRNDFQWRAEGWEFYGSVEGGVSVRRQNSGGLKMTSCYGDIKEITAGFRDMIAKNPGVIIWGVMPQDLCRALEFLTRSTKDFKRLPGVIVKIAFPYLAKALGMHGAGASVGLDGGVTVDTPAGPMKKFLIGNKNYFDFLKDGIENSDTTKLPIPAPVINTLKGMVNLLL